MNAGGLLATTANVVSDGDFLADGMTPAFYGTSSAADHAGRRRGDRRARRSRGSRGGPGDSERHDRRPRVRHGRPARRRAELHADPGPGRFRPGRPRVLEPTALPGLARGAVHLPATGAGHRLGDRRQRLPRHGFLVPGRDRPVRLAGGVGDRERTRRERRRSPRRRLRWRCRARLHHLPAPRHPARGRTPAGDQHRQGARGLHPDRRRGQWQSHGGGCRGPDRSAGRGVHRPRTLLPDRRSGTRSWTGGSSTHRRRTTCRTPASTAGAPPSGTATSRPTRRRP